MGSISYLVVNLTEGSPRIYLRVKGVVEEEGFKGEGRGGEGCSVGWCRWYRAVRGWGGVQRFGEDTGWTRRRCPASTRILWTYQAILIVSSGCKPADLIILGVPGPRTYVGTSEQWRFLA